MICCKRQGAVMTLFLLSSCLLMVVGASLQLLTRGVIAWQQEISALVLDNNGEAACRALARDCNFQLSGINVSLGRHGVQIEGDGVQWGRNYRFFCQPSPENGRQTLYRSVSVNAQNPGVNPLTDPHSVEIVGWQAQRMADNVVWVRFRLREIRWGNERDYNVLLTAYNVKYITGEKERF